MGDYAATGSCDLLNAVAVWAGIVMEIVERLTFGRFSFPFLLSISSVSRHIGMQGKLTTIMTPFHPLLVAFFCSYAYIDNAVFVKKDIFFALFMEEKSSLTL